MCHRADPTSPGRTGSGRTGSDDLAGGPGHFASGTLTALVELPIGGLMSDEPAGVVAKKSARVMQALAERGCALNNGYM